MAEEGLACDVAGGGELHMALKAGFDPGRIHLHGNAKSRRELEEAHDAGVGHVVLDNISDIERLEEIVAPGERQPVQMRIAPGVSPDTHPSISTGGPNTKFGFNLDAAAPAIERVMASDKLDLEGLHIHIGSQIVDLAPFRPAIAALADLGDFPHVQPRRRPRRRVHRVRRTRRASRTTSPSRSTPSSRSPGRGSGSSTSRAARSSRTRPSRSTPSSRSSATS